MRGSGAAMTLFPNRLTLILLATTALAGAASPVLAQMPRPNFPIHQEQVAPQATADAPARREDPPMPAVPEPEGIQSRPLEQLARREPPPAATEAYAPTPRKLEVAERSGGRRVVAATAATYKVKKGDNLAGIARNLGVDLEDLARENGLKSPYRLSAGQVLKAPGSAARADANADAVSDARADAKTYVVGKGDNLAAIARKMGVDQDDLAKANGLKSPYRLNAGQVLKAPGSARVETRAEARSEARTGAKSYVVGRGDNLAAIARKMGVGQDDLARENGLKPPYRLKTGQVLKAPGAGGAVEARAEPRTEAKSYVVRKGDTLYSIGRKLGFTPKELADANNISVRKGLSAGRRLVLPGAEAEARKPAVEPETPAPRTRRGRTSAVEPTSEAPAERAGSGGRTSVSGKVIEVEGGASSHKVRKGDTVDEIADDMGISRKELTQLNKLKPPYALKVGRVLKGPPKQVKAYVPVEGDTLALIGKRFGLSAKAIAAANNMRSSAAVRPGKRLILPSGFRDRGPLRETPRSTAAPAYTPPPYNPPPYNPPPERPTPTPVTPQPYTPPAYTPPAYTPPPNRPAAPTPTTGPLSDSQISSLGRGRFEWPLRGDIMSEFGPKGTGQRNDGINIRARDGDPVRAAAAGDVVYAGDQVPGFGNLVLVKHADGWVTAYGHLGRVDVKMQQKVVQGQQLGMAGTSGGVNEPQLHFEVRYAPSPTERARPVDPQLVLGR
jgi:murein DD-endopeptidase MepM/ murein hydrolase activator NlpD